jgi:DNA-binding transcriptional ArsR family regulator
MITTLELESKLFKGFADQSRLAILKAIADAPTTVSTIVKATQLLQPNVSMHLACLLECGLVQKEKKGREVFYSISTPEVTTLLITASKAAKKNAHNIKQCKRY